MLMLETALNHYLALDPETSDKLAAFSGKVIKMEITGINQKLYFLPDRSGIQILTQYDEEPDTILRGSLSSLFKMGLVSNVTDLLLTGEVEISGDTRLGHKFKHIFSNMDIDWSEPLSEIFGEAIAYQLVQSAKKLTDWSKNTTQSFSQSLSEYLQEESRDVVTETELSMFNSEVDAIRNDVDRLQAKVNALLNQTNTHHDKPNTKK